MIFFVVVLALRFIVRLRFPTEVPISTKNKNKQCPVDEIINDYSNEWYSKINVQ